MDKTDIECRDFTVSRVLPPKGKPSYILFQRNNLRLSQFKRVGVGYVYESDSNFKGVHGTIRIRVKNEDLHYTLFSVKSKVISVHGKSTGFSVRIKLKDRRTPPIDEEISVGDVTISIHCEGEAWPDWKGKYVGLRKMSSGLKISKAPARVISATSWTAQHPYNGGSVTPR